MKLNFAFPASLTITLLLVVFPARATVIEALTFQQVARQADLIVEAEVIPKSRKTHLEGGTPWTCQTLRVLRILKGSAGASQEICFYGGQVGDYIYTASGLVLPTEGKKGFFFLHDSAGHFTNPMVGWEQGGFYIEPGVGDEAVTTFSGEPITGIDLDARINQPPSEAGTAIGVSTSGTESISPTEFIGTTLRAISGDNP